MAVARGCEIPELFPRPKQIILDGGISELGLDVRLATSNVLPLQRKAVRSVLTAAGVRVVANKKKYLVNAVVESPAVFDLSSVPQDCQRDYYELSVKGSEVHIRSPYQEGMVWAAQTAAELFGMLHKGLPVPNLTIHDWPLLPVRGIFIENKWGPDRMTSTDWFQAIDAVSSVKMNTLGVGLYGCWGSCRFEGAERPSEFLMLPSPFLPEDEDEPQLDEFHHEHRLRWYDAAHDLWHDETYLPYLTQHDFFPEIISYGKERGVNIVPFFNSLGHNTLLPRIMPEIAALDAEGKPAGMGYCLSSEKTREFIGSYYGKIIKKYFPEGLEYFHVELDEVYADHPHPEQPLKKESPWCQCQSCQGKERKELLEDYLVWLSKFLLGKGVQKVVLWNDQLTRHDDILDAGFVKRLKAEGLKDKLILHWWWYNNEKLHEGVHPRLGLKLGLDAWVAPMTCYYNWSTYDFRRPNIEMMLKMAELEGARGAVAYSVHDPANLDHEALLGVYAWESIAAAGSLDKVQQRWAAQYFGRGAKRYIESAETLREASQNPALKLCLQYQYSYVRENLEHWPRRYPEEALLALAELPKAEEQLQTVARLASQAAEGFEALLEDKEQLGYLHKNCLMSLLADSVRAQCLAECFIFLLELRRQLEKKSAGQKEIEACAEQNASLKEKLQVFAANKPIWVLPAALQPLSMLLLFMQNLEKDLQKANKAKNNKNITWYIPDDWQVPEN